MWVFSTLLLVGVLFAVPASATFSITFDYQLMPCGGLGQAPCPVSTGRLPTASDVAGLTNTLFQQYFSSQGIVQGGTATYLWTAKMVNNAGYVIGKVDGSNDLHTAFIYHDGAVTCCITDDPFTLNGINNNNIVVGLNPYAGTHPQGLFLGLANQLNPDRNSIDLHFLNATTPLDSIFPGIVAIDDHNNIDLGFGSGPGFPHGQHWAGFYVSPEPESIALMATVLVSLLVPLLRLRTAPGPQSSALEN